MLFQWCTSFTKKYDLLLERLLLGNPGTWFLSPPCPPNVNLGLGGSLEGGVLESLLAYSCIGGALAALNGTREQRLPQYSTLTPETIMYTVGVFEGQKGATCTFG
ncbi:hypothetical protein MRX96_023922 [Rhipicephalus microplus]